MIDYHVHIHPHGESGRYELERVRQYCAVAIQRGIDEIGFSEHVFRFVEFRDVVGDWWNDTDDPKTLRDHCERYFFEHATQSIGDYLELIQRGKEAGLPLRAGLELDYYPGRMTEVAEFLAALDLDFVLGSVHWIGAWGFDNEEVAGEWKRRDVDTVYAAYFELLSELAGSGVAQVLAHPDLVKKFGRRPDRFDLAEAYCKIVSSCKEAGVGLEVSSAGWRVPAREQYPARRFLEVALDGGVQLTTSSDAHVPELVGHGIDELCELLRGLGCEAVYGYRRKKPVRIPLDSQASTANGSTPYGE